MDSGGRNGIASGLSNPLPNRRRARRRHRHHRRRPTHRRLLAANTGANPLTALTEGFQSGFLVVPILAGIGVALALLLLGRPRGVPQVELKPSPVPAGD
jgi:hypothetical protein